jgi:hypothetical protein
MGSVGMGVLLVETCAAESSVTSRESIVGVGVCRGVLAADDVVWLVPLALLVTESTAALTLGEHCCRKVLN